MTLVNSSIFFYTFFQKKQSYFSLQIHVYMFFLNQKLLQNKSRNCVFKLPFTLYHHPQDFIAVLSCSGSVPMSVSCAPAGRPVSERVRQCGRDVQRYIDMTRIPAVVQSTTMWLFSAVLRLLGVVETSYTEYNNVGETSGFTKTCRLGQESRWRSRVHQYPWLFSAFNVS